MTSAHIESLSAWKVTSLSGLFSLSDSELLSISDTALSDDWRGQARQLMAGQVPKL